VAKQQGTCHRLGRVQKSRTGLPSNGSGPKAHAARGRAMGGGASKPPPGGVTPQDNVIVQRLEKLEVAVKGRDDAQAAAQAAKDAEIAALKQVAELTNALALAKSPQKTYSSASATRVSSGDGALSALAAEVEELREQLSEAHEKIEEETFAHEQTRAASRQHVQVPASVWCLVFRAPSAPRCRAYPAYPLPAAGPASARASSVRASVTPGWRTAQSVEEDVQKLQQQLEEATEALSDEKFAHEQTKKAALTQVEMLTEELGKPGSAAAGGGEASETSFHAIVLDLRGKLADALVSHIPLCQARAHARMQMLPVCRPHIRFPSVACSANLTYCFPVAFTTGGKQQTRGRVHCRSQQAELSGWEHRQVGR